MLFSNSGPHPTSQQGSIFHSFIKYFQSAYYVQVVFYAWGIIKRLKKGNETRLCYCMTYKLVGYEVIQKFKISGSNMCYEDMFSYD